MMKNCSSGSMIKSFFRVVSETTSPESRFYYWTLIFLQNGALFFMIYREHCYIDFWPFVKQNHKIFHKNPAIFVCFSTSGINFVANLWYLSAIERKLSAYIWTGRNSRFQHSGLSARLLHTHGAQGHHTSFNPSTLYHSDRSEIYREFEVRFLQILTNQKFLLTFNNFLIWVNQLPCYATLFTISSFFLHHIKIYYYHHWDPCLP